MENLKDMINQFIEHNIEKIFDFNSLYPTYHSSFEIGRSEYLTTKNNSVFKDKIKNIKKIINVDNKVNNKPKYP